jgi:hypothetical protein
MKLFITLLENVNKSLTKSGRLSLKNNMENSLHVSGREVYAEANQSSIGNAM